MADRVTMECEHEWIVGSDGVVFCNVCKIPRRDFEPQPLGAKHDDGKEPMGLLPPAALLDVARVLAYGAEKYSPNNWRKVKPGSRYLDAALRHLFAYADGEEKDSESGLPHLAHAACCVLFMLELGDCRHENRS